MGNENGNNGNEGQEIVHQNNQNNQNSQGNNEVQTIEHHTVIDANNLEFGSEIRQLILTAGTLDLPEEKNNILFAPVKPDEVFIKPDGLIYMTWVKYAGRLSKAVGLSWTMIPQGMPKISKDAQNNNLVIWGFHLMIKGVYCGFAIGEQQYHENKRMTYGEACEGAKSNALTRLCKAIGIGIELWDKSFINDWLGKYADKKWKEGEGSNRGKFEWFLKPNAFANINNNNAQIAAPAAASVPSSTAPVQTTNTAQVTQTPKVETPKVETPKTETPKVDNATPAKEATKVTITTTTKPAPVKTTPVETKTETPKNNGNGNGKKPGYTGKHKQGKMAENTDFLSQKGKEEVPIVPLEETAPELTGKNAKNTAESLDKDLDNSKTTGQLKMNYEKVRASLTAGEITEEEKEVLRKKANGLFVKLAAEGK